MTAPAETLAPPTTATSRAGVLSAVVLGCALTLCLTGYYFGTSNHTVYLVDALRRTDPSLLANDWFTTKTLQYHAAFGLFTETMMRLDLLRQCFFVAYLALVVALHAGIFRLVTRLGGTPTTYLLTVLLFELSAAGTGLGAYQFLQDGSLLPSNLAAVAMLWGIVMYLSGNWLGAAACLGLSGLFHLNYAVVAPVLWVFLIAAGRPTRRTALPASAVAFALPALNILLAVRAGLLSPGPTLPLPDFIELYVRLRHPHHYHPASWPVALWLTFIWPFPFAVYAFRHNRTAKCLLGFFTALLLLALLTAGVFYLSATLVQLSLYRISIFPKLITCAGAALLLTPHATNFFRILIPLTGVAAVASHFLPLPSVARAALPTFAVFGSLACLAAIRRAFAHRPAFHAAVAAAAIVVLTLNWSRLGLRYVPDDDPAYLDVCRFAAASTPKDAVFLVPPDEQSFRLHARRAIVVNFKAVPQLARELPEWDRRLRDVLGLDSLLTLPRGFGNTLAAIREAYDARTVEALAAVGRQYGATFVVTTHEVAGWRARLLHNARGRYFLYSLPPPAGG